MPGSVEIIRTKRRNATSPAVDFAILVIGAASLSPLGDNAISPPYGSPEALAEDYGIGDGVDAAQQAVKRTDGNPSPPAVAFCRTPATTHGSIGTIALGLMVGTTVPTALAAAAPLGTWQTRVRVSDDGNGGGGTTVGTSGIVLEASIDNGYHWLPAFELGTGTTVTIYLPDENGPIDTGVKYALEPPAAQITAMVTRVNDLRTKALAHFVYTTGTVHTNADNTSGSGIAAAATNTATTISLMSTILTALGLHFARGSGQSIHINVAGDNVTSLAAATAAVAAAVASGTAQDAITALSALTAAFAAHEAGTTWHTIADAVNVVTATAPTRGTLKTGDQWSAPTSPPMWTIGDIFTGGGTPTGALANVASSLQNFGLLVLTEPVASGEVATLSAGLDYITARNASRRPSLLIRFRDPTPGETDAAYILAFQTWRGAFAGDARISCVAGPGVVTDALRSYVWKRSGLAPLLARLQSNASIPGPLGEKLAEHPGLGARLGLEGFSLYLPDGTPYGHDERVRGGIDGPIGGKGGGITFYYEAHDELAGTYVSNAPCLYPQGSTVLTLMDNRVASGIERELYAVGFTALKGADVFDEQTLTLDPDIRDALAARAMAAIKAKYSTEIQNANDPNLVQVDEVIELDGSNVGITWQVKDRLFGYTDKVRIFHNISR